MRTHILIDIDTQEIVSSVLWDGITYHPTDAPAAWQPPPNMLAIPYDGMWRHGWKWNGREAYDPNPAPPPPTTAMNPDPPRASTPIPAGTGMRIL